MHEEPAVVDVDVHPYVKGGIQTLAQYMPRAMRSRLRSEMPTISGHWATLDPNEVSTQYLDKHSVAAVILIPIESISGYTDPITASNYAAASNRYFVENWLPVDRRFRLALMLAPHEPAKAAAEIKRHAQTSGVAAAFLPLLNVLMGDRYYYPIYKAAERHELPIIVHPTGPEGIYLGAPMVAGGVPATPLERAVALPHIAQANISSLVLRGVLEDFPRLRFIFAEFGFAWVLPLMWRMDLDWRRVRRETPWVKRRPSEYVQDRIRFTTQPFDKPQKPEHLGRLMEMIGAERTLLFGSDYPYGSDGRADLESLPPTLKERIFFRNALETFGSRLADVQVPN